MPTREAHVFYRNRPEWSDITPVPQDDGGRTIVKIAYSEQFVDTHDYLRAVILKDERSQRTLELTADALLLNPANYTTWEYRRRIIETISADLKEELRYVSAVIDINSKNYQLWHHRQWVVEQICNSNRMGAEEPNWSQLADQELDFTASIISDDSKHYHAWQYRRWVLSRFQYALEKELAYTEELLEDDVYNNSAWNHRFNIVSRDEGLTESVMNREIQFVQNKIRAAPCNESAWNYLYGLCTFTTPMDTQDQIPKSNLTVESTNNLSTHVSQHQIVNPRLSLRSMREFAEQLAKTDRAATDSLALLSFLVDVYSDCLQDLITSRVCKLKSVDGENTLIECNERKSQTNSGDNPESMHHLLGLAVELCDRLATELDRIRVNYWNYRGRQLKSMVEQATSVSS